ncbi:MAG: zinc-binding dehydrogenase [Chlorobi bacterium]|nr:zinc-binding dehydrogenase [Chlorobiota bacterium]
MRSVVLPGYNKNVLRAMLSLRIEDRPMPVLKEGEVLIKTSAAACNPSDIAFIQGAYNIVKPVPAIPGFEGAGQIVDAARNAEYLIGKKVSAFVQSDNSGTWAEYFVAKTSDIIVLTDEMPDEQAACFTVNPFTAYAMFKWVENISAKAVVQNAAGSQVASFIRMMANENGVEVIDIVRKSETASMLEGMGAKHVLLETDVDFNDKLKLICDELKPRLAFDAVGGSLSGEMYNALAPNSRMLVYGGLSNKPLSGLGVMDTIFHDKTVMGFNLIDWKLRLKEGEFDVISLFLQEKFIRGPYKTRISKTIRFDEVIKGIKSYLGNMSAGKLLLKP